MNKLIRKTQWTCVGLLVAMTCGAPAIADDTEILLVNPNSANPPQPNVLFIFDTSGSMGDEVDTRVQYDSERDYPNAVAGCDADRLYWTLVDSVPACGFGNTQYVEKTSFSCNAATPRMNGIGSYSGTMVQYRNNGVATASTSSWQALEPGVSTGLVECVADSGVHGDGGTDTFALKGNSGTTYTSDADQEIDWTNNDTSNSVTVYDGNYLNYRAVPEIVSETKIKIVRDVATTVMNAIEDVNVGIMRFNDEEGGSIIQEVVDLDANRTDIVNTIATLNDSGWTPLSETMYEAALYWRGMPANYGADGSDFATDPDAFASTDPDVYKRPAMSACTKNFNVLLTDGEPTEDLGTPGLVNALPNWFSALGSRTGCTGTGEGDCLDDVAEYLFKEDVHPTMNGKQDVTTHTIGFAINLPVMRQAAANSGGQYFLADDVESLTLALLKIVSIVQDRSLSFTAPAVAVNSFNRTQNLNDLYLTTFGARGKVHWPGNLKKYSISGGRIVDATGADAVNPATGFFDTGARSIWSSGVDGIQVEVGGAAENLPAPGSRNIFTNNGSSNDLTANSNGLTTGNIGAFTQADFGLTGTASEPTLTQMIMWARGLGELDGNGDRDFAVPRNDIGDPLHSQPAAVVYGGSAATPDTVIYTATNDGYVHAIDGANGRELWAFVPKEHLASFSQLYANLDSSVKNYGVDGDIVPVIKDFDDDGIIESADGDFVVIIFGMRRGGGNYYALDVTNKTSPRLLWQFNDPNIGQSWSTPTVARIDMASSAGQNAEKAVVVIGGGYDTVHDTLAHPLTADGRGAGIYFLDLQSGNILWRASSAAAAELTLSKMTRGIPSAVRVIDLNGDGFADRMYASDLGGQLWRFDISGGKAPNGIGSDALVAGGVIAQLGAEGNLPVTNADTRRFYSSPDVSLFSDNVQNRRFIAISIGSGYRAHPLNNTTDERFYSIRDKSVFGQLTQSEYDALTPITETDLVEVRGTVGATIRPEDDGWMFTLPPNQKVLTESATFNDEIFFVAFSPDPDMLAPDSCASGVGRNFLYRVSVTNGDPIADLDNVVSGTEDALRVTNLAQGGIAPSPRFLFPSPDTNCPPGQDCSQPVLTCVGVECRPPGFDNDPVRTLWTQDGIE